MQGSWGAAFHNELVLHESDIVVHYGFETHIASREESPQSPSCVLTLALCVTSLRFVSESLFSDRSTNVCSIQYAARELELEELYFAGVALDGAILQV